MPAILAPLNSTHLDASLHLAEVDPVMARLVEVVGPPDFRPSHDSAFEALARSIVFQQLAGAAATTIWGRFRALVPGRLTPSAVLALAVEDLRAAGLSGNKARSIV